MERKRRLDSFCHNWKKKCQSNIPKYNDIELLANISPTVAPSEVMALDRALSHQDDVSKIHFIPEVHEELEGRCFGANGLALRL